MSEELKDGGRQRIGRGRAWRGVRAGRAVVAVSREQRARDGTHGNLRVGLLGLVLRAHLCPTRGIQTRGADRLAQPGRRRDGLAVVGEDRSPDAADEPKCWVRRPKRRPRSRSPSRQRPPPGTPPPYGAQPAAKPAWMLAMERRLGGAVSEGPEVRKDASSAPPSDGRGRANPPDESGATPGDSALECALASECHPRRPRARAAGASGCCCRKARSSTARSRPRSTRRCPA